MLFSLLGVFSNILQLHSFLYSWNRVCTHHWNIHQMQHHTLSASKRKKEHCNYHTIGRVSTVWADCQYCKCSTHHHEPSTPFHPCLHWANIWKSRVLFCVVYVVHVYHFPQNYRRIGNSRGKSSVHQVSIFCTSYWSQEIGEMYL